jgi:hypothetical protein
MKRKCVAFLINHIANRKVLEKEFERYQQQLSGPTETPEVDTMLAPTSDFNDLDMIGESQAIVQSVVDPGDD